MFDGDSEIEITKPEKEFVVNNLETLKVVSDPLRMQILEYMLEQPRTVKQIAAQLSISPTKLYYHMNMLEEHGLIRVVSTRVVSGIIEKQYWLRAYSLKMAPELFSASGMVEDQGFSLLTSSVLNLTHKDIMDSLKAGLIDVEQPEKRQPFILTRSLFRLTPDRAKELQARLKQIMKEFGTIESKEPDALTYGMTLAFYPTKHDSGGATDESGQTEPKEGAGK